MSDRARGLALIGIVSVVPLWYALAASWRGFALVTVVSPSVVLALMALVGLCAWSGDPWAGAFVAYLLARLFFTPQPGGLNVVVYAAIGLGVYAMARTVPDAWVPRVQAAAVAVGAVQAGWLILFALKVPPFTWWAWSGATLGNANFAAAYLAIAACWIPWWLVPLWAGGLIASQSALGALAFSAAILLRARYVWVAAGWGILACGSTWWYRGTVVHSWAARGVIWRWGLHEWLTHAPMFGLGVGAWAPYEPTVMNAQTGLQIDNRFLMAHNEVLQLGFETGLVGLAILGAWAWSHRTAWAAPRARALLAAVLIESLAMFPFHVASVAVLALVALGLATRRDDETLARAPAAP